MDARRELWAPFGLAAFAALLGLAGCLDPAVDPVVCSAVDPPTERFLVAGNGAASALLRRWVHAQGAEIDVPESIGSSGGYAALRDRRIRVAVAARPPTDRESDGIAVVFFARCPMVLALHEANPTVELSTDEIAALYLGELRTWDHGAAVVPLLREPGDTGEAVVGRARPALARALDEARSERRWPVARSDEDTAGQVLQIPGAFAFVDAALIQPVHRTPRVDGVAWSDPAWPFHREFHLAWWADDAEASALARELLEGSSDAAATLARVLDEAGCRRVGAP